MSFDFSHFDRLNSQPVVKDFFHHVERTSGFTLPPSFRNIFLAYHHHFTAKPCPAFTADYGESSPNWKWQKIHVNSILGSAQSSLGAVLYHRENLLRLERDIYSFADLSQLIDVLGPTTISPGNTQKLDYEYHAFIFAYRRTLDYLTRGLAALLKLDFHSFRSLPKLLNNYSEVEWVKELIESHATFVPHLQAFLGSGDSKSTRDTIAHYTHVAAGCLNVNAQGLFLAGGGENLRMTRETMSDPKETLDSRIQNYIDLLRQILTRFLTISMQGHPK